MKELVTELRNKADRLHQIGSKDKVQIDYYTLGQADGLRMAANKLLLSLIQKGEQSCTHNQ